jgi:Tol biopolymer transport system component
MSSRALVRLSPLRLRRKAAIQTRGGIGITLTLVAGLLLGTAGCGEVKIERRDRDKPETTQSQITTPERHLSNIRALTSRGVNRQADFSADGRLIVWQSRSTPGGAGQVLIMNADGTGQRQVPFDRSRFEGPCFLPDGSALLFASSPMTTEADSNQAIPPPAIQSPAPRENVGTPQANKGLQDEPLGWLFNPGYDIWRAPLGGGLPSRLTTTAGYDAEITTSWGGARLLFTSFRDGTPGIYQMNADGSGQTLVLSLGVYIGGARISPDGNRIAFHAAPTSGKGLEIFVADIDGRNPIPLTAAGAVSFGPCWHPSGEYLLFSSNRTNWDYELYRIRPDGSGLKQITHSPGFDAFPAFSRDGRQLLWTSARGAEAGESQIYRAAWLP